jgi:hypothetical protein
MAGGAAGGDAGGAAGGMAGGAAGGMAGGAAGGVAGGSAGGVAGGSAGGMAGGSAGGVAGGAAGGSAGGAAGLDGGIEQLFAVRALADSSPDGGVVTGSIAVEGVLVTYLKPLVDAGVGVSVEPGGFFVQADPSGPAVFVAVPPATDNVAVGDLVSFTVTSTSRPGGLRQVTSYTGFSRSSQGNPVSSYVRSASGVDFTNAQNVTEWESRLLSLAGAVTQTPANAGNGYRAMNISTAGTPDGGSLLRLRVPAPLAEAEDLQPGCTVSLSGGPMWRFGAAAQPSAFLAPELAGTSCPAPRVIAARADSATAVVVSFDRNLAPSSVGAGAFTFAALDGGAALTASAAAVTGPREATVTTNAMNGAAYRLTCATSVTDSRGTMVSATANTADFTGFMTGGCMPGLVISQVYGGGGNTGAPLTHDFVELRNRTASPINLAGLSLQYQSGGGTTWAVSAALSGVIPANGYFLVQFAGGSTGVALPTPDQVIMTSPQNLSGTNGKVALVSGTSALASACPTSGVIDLVSYGSTTSACAEGQSAPAPSNTLAVVRGGAGCLDTQMNGTDFTAAAPAPRNSATAPGAACSCP